MMTHKKQQLELISVILSISFLFGLSAHDSVWAQQSQSRVGQSAYEYIDHEAPPVSRYAVPQKPVDPTDISIETFKEQIVRLEERIERLEKACEVNGLTEMSRPEKAP